MWSPRRESNPSLIFTWFNPPKMRSATELRGLELRRGLEPRSLVYETSTSPSTLAKHGAGCGNRNRASTLARLHSATEPIPRLERATDNDPASVVWKTSLEENGSAIELRPRELLWSCQRANNKMVETVRLELTYP